MGYSFSWRHNLEVFARARDVYAFDLLGMGLSDRPPAAEADFSMPAAATRLLELLRSLVQSQPVQSQPAHSQFDLVATSHGGAVAMQAAIQDRASPGAPLIRRLALIAPAHPFMPNARLRLALIPTSFGSLLLRALGGMYGAGLVGLGLDELRSKLLGRLYANPSLITPETRIGYAVCLDDPRSYDYAIEVVRTWQQDMHRLRAALPSIAAIPVLLLWGADDPAVSAESGLLLREFFRSAEYLVLPGVGHLPYEEAPAEFNHHVLQFLNRQFAPSVIPAV
jgi:pimeloyl-ACP methyl ester carboxylesterase